MYAAISYEESLEERKNDIRFWHNSFLLCSTNPMWSEDVEISSVGRAQAIH